MGPTLLPKTAASWFSPTTTLSPEDARELEGSVALAAAGIPFGLDRWDGYPAARANLVTLSGDSHNAWAYDLAHDGRPAGVEFAGHAVSSLGLEKRFDGDPAKIAADFVAANPAVK